MSRETRSDKGIDNRTFYKGHLAAYRDKAAGFVRDVCIPAGCLNAVAPSGSGNRYRCGDLAISAQKVVRMFSNGEGCNKALTDQGWAQVYADGRVVLKVI